jgi:hypothetical protein
MCNVSIRLLFAALALTSAGPGGEAAHDYIFPGGVSLQVKADEMTDKRLCTLFTPMQGVQVAVSGDGLAVVWTHDSFNVSHTPPPLMRIGEAPPFELSVPDRPHLMGVPAKHAATVVAALYGGEKIRVRFSDWPSGDSKNFEVGAGDFGAGYDRARAVCGWSPLEVKRALMSKEPRIFRSNNGYVSASFGGDTGGWTVTLMPQFKSCSIKAGGTDTLVETRNGSGEKVLRLGTMRFKDAEGNSVANVVLEGYAVSPFEEILAAADKAGEYGTVTFKFKTFSLFGFQEAVDYAERTCEIHLRKAHP